MAKFCPNCGNPIEAGDAFCNNCGAKLGAQPTPQPERAATQAYGDPYTQTPQPSQQPQQQYAPYRQPVRQPNQPYPQYGYPQPPKKKKTGLIIALSIAGVIAVSALVIMIFFLVKIINPDKDNPQPTVSENVTEQVTEAATEAPTEEPDEKPTEAPTELPTEAPTQAPTKAPVKLPYTDSLGKISATDFAWISDAMGGGLQGSFLSRDDSLGRWKGEFIFDGVWELVYITIDVDGTITVEPYRINYGDGWEDESGDAAYSFSGSFDINRVYGSGGYGSIDLYQFLESGGSQYAVGELRTNTGNKAAVYLVRP